MRATTLDQACELITDGTHYTPPDVGEGVAFLTVKDMTESGLNFTGCSRIAPAEFEEAKRQNSAPVLGDVLFSKDGTVGKVHVVESSEPFAILSSIAILRPIRSVLDSRYLAHLLRSPALVYSADQKKTGSALRRIILRDIKQLEIPLPPLEEQKRIAGILDQADALRRLRTRTLDKLNTLGQAIFHEMFGRPSGNDNGQVDLGDLLTFVTSGGRGWAKYYYESGPRFIRSLDVQMNAIGNDDVVFVDPPDNAEARRTRTETGDVLLTITGSKIGRVAPLPESLVGSFVSQHVAILRPDQSRVLPSFLSYFLSMEQFGQAQIKAKQYGQAKPGLNFEQIRAFQFPSVSIERQQKFVNVLANVDSTRLRCEYSGERSGLLFSSLQHRAFRGDL